MARSQEDIDRLQARLDHLLVGQLDEPDRQLLADIFEVAKEAIERPARDRFVQSFNPGEEQPPPPFMFNIRI